MTMKNATFAYLFLFTASILSILILFAENIMIKEAKRIKPIPKNATCPKHKHLKRILLAINYNFPHYFSIPVLRKTYGDIFGKIVFCGQRKHPDVIQINERSGYQAYMCLSTAIEMYPNYDGYFQSNDDVLLNWWNLVPLDSSKLWFGDKSFLSLSHLVGAKRIPTGWYWWAAENSARRCEKAFRDMEKVARTDLGITYGLNRYFKSYYNYTNNRNLCMRGFADVFYIPKEHSKIFQFLARIFYRQLVFLEVTVPTIMTILRNDTNYIELNGEYYLPKYNQHSKTYLSGEAFFESYSFKSVFIHPFKLGRGMIKAKRGFMSNVYLYTSEWVRRKCIDAM